MSVLQSSGAISLSQARAVATANGASLSPNHLSHLLYRRMARKPSGAISMSDLYGKSTPVIGTLNPDLFNGSTFNVYPTSGAAYIHIYIHIYANDDPYNFTIEASGLVAAHYWVQGNAPEYTDNYALDWSWGPVTPGLAVSPAQSGVIISSEKIIQIAGPRVMSAAVLNLHIYDRFDPSRSLTTSFTINF